MSAIQNNAPLPADFQIGEYRIVRQLSMGGFSIVYLAEDGAGDIVAIKEYLPNSLALRTEGQISPTVEPENETVFRHGMKCFFEEGLTLSQISHPNIVRVLNFFRANGTVYMVMGFEDGQTLAQYIKKRREHVRPLSEKFIRNVFSHLLHGLREVHIARLLHLDIKPANIYLHDDGMPVLLDFGAARQTLFADRPILRPMFTPGYSSPELYRSAVPLGPWTDIYSIGASMYVCITGKAPQRAERRLQEDKLRRLAHSKYLTRYSSNLLTTIDHCLQIEPLLRPSSVMMLQKMLRGEVPSPNEVLAQNEAEKSTSNWSGRFKTLFGIKQP